MNNYELHYFFICTIKKTKKQSVILLILVPFELQSS